MKGILVDSNVILDIATEDKTWFNWSAKMLSDYSEHATLFINKIIYSEISVGYKRIEELEVILSMVNIERAVIPWEAAFLAGKAYLQYKKIGGNRSQPLPDFFIAAHALVENFVLLTRDSQRFQHYFPRLKIVSP